MEKKLSITIPYEKNAIAAAAVYLNDVARELKTPSESIPPVSYEPVKLKIPPVSTPLVDTPSLGTVNPDLIDKFGVVWHPEYHTSNKSKRTDGGWRMKPGINKDKYAGYCSQFDVPPPVQNVGPTSPPVPVQNVGPTSPPVPVQDVGPTSNAGIPVREYNPITTPTSVPMPATFAELMNGLVPKKAAGLISEEQVAGVLVRYQLNSLADLNLRTDLIPQIWAELETIWRPYTHQ
jgi:hypothetical protein